MSMSIKVEKLTVPEAAAIMGVTPQFLRMGLPRCPLCGAA